MLPGGYTFHGVSLNTETTANVAFYRYFGYEVIRHDQVGEGLETWTMYRPNH